MGVNVKGLILKEQNIGENDKLVTVLTDSLGVLRAFVRGAKKLNSKKQSATGLLCYSKLSLYKTKDSYIIEEAESIESFFGLRNDIEKLSLAQYFCDIAFELSPKEDDATDFLRVVLNSLYFLANGKRPPLLLKAITELRLVSLAGYMPNLIACERCGAFETPIMYFDMERGLLYCDNCADENALFPLEIGVVSAMRHIVFAKIDILYNFKLSPEASEDLSYITEKYLASKTDRPFKTLDFLLFCKGLIMNKYHISLELPKILLTLSEMTSCEEARLAALSLQPSGDFFEVQKRLSETEAAHILIAKFGAPSFGGLINVNNQLSRASSGGTLSMRELLDISCDLRVIRGITEWRSKSAGMDTAIDDLFNSLYTNKYLEDKINNAVLSDTEMSDNASPALKDIRRHKRLEESKIRDKLDGMIRSPKYKSSLQDAIITQRNGRFVVPVKAEHRSEVSGMVHDTSGSGATVFIEPAAVIEANNRIKVLESRERDEIERILSELSEEAGSFADTIKISCESAAELNLIFSKAQLAYKMKATMPIINSRGVIELKKARHPLLDPKKSRAHRRVARRQI